ncbi:melanocortin receptor 5-like [Oculina patagonica]
MTFEERCFFLDSHNEPGKIIFIVSVTTIVMNLTCSLIATTGNGIILATFWKSNQLRSPSHLLLMCLTFADFLTGLIVQQFYAAYKITHLTEHYSLSCLFRVIMETVAWFSAAVSCVMFAAITGDRYIALHFHLRYQQVVSTKRVIGFIVYVLVFFGSMTASRFALEDSKPFLVVSVVGLFFSLLVLLISVWKIYLLVRRHHRQIQSHQINPANQNTLDFRSLKKSAFNMAVVASLFMIAYLPFTSVLIAYLVHGFTTNIEAAYDITRTIAFMTASWNPFLYCLKMADVREEVKKTLKKRTDATGPVETL